MPIRKDELGLGTVRVRKFHECQKPSMLLEEKTITYTQGFWPFKRTKSYIKQCYEEHEARWDCPVCKSKWRWSPGYGDYAGATHNKGTWFAITRNSEWVAQ